MKSFLGSERCYIIAFCLACVPIFWGHGVIDGIDINWKDNALTELFMRISGIDPSINGGADRSNNYATLLWMGAQALFTTPFYESGILSPAAEVAAQRVFYGFIIFLIAAVFLRTCEQLSESRLRFFPGIIAGIYFCYSYYFYFAWARLQLNIMSVPLFLATLTLAFAFNKNNVRREWLYWFLPCAFLSATIGLQPPLIALWMFEVILLALVMVPGMAAKLRFGSLAALGFVLMNIYWIVPFAAFVTGNHLADGENSREVFNVLSLFNFVSGYTTYSNVLAGAADFTFYDSFIKPYNIAAFHSMAADSPRKLLLVGFAAAVLIFAVRRYRPTTGNVIRALVVLYLMAAFISLGGFGPQGDIMRYLVSEAPLFWVFRATWQKSGMLQLVTISLLLYLALRELFTWLQGRDIPLYAKRMPCAFIWKGLPAGLFIGLAVLMLYIHNDFIRGEHLPSHKTPDSYGFEVQAAYRPEIPEWIYSVAKTIDQPGCMSVLLPVSPVNLIKWGWGGSSDVLLSRGLLKQSTLIFKEYGEGYTVSGDLAPRQRNEKLFKMLTGNAPVDLKLLRDMGVCYFVLRTDFNDRKDFTPLPVSFYRQKLERTPGLKRIPLAGYQAKPGEQPWQVYQAAPPASLKNGITREQFLFDSHFAYYVASADPKIDEQFVRIHIPGFMPVQADAQIPWLVARPFVYFIIGAVLFISGLFFLVIGVFLRRPRAN